MVSPFQVALDDVDRVELERRVRAGNTPQKVVLRAVIVLLAADGASNAAIADELGICVDTARKWRARFCAKGIKALVDAPRSGRPPVYTPTDVARVKAWACELPAEHQLPLSRWSAPELARQLLTDGIGASVSTVRRWLAPGRPQTLAVPVVDFHPGSTVRGQGGGGVGPVRPQVRRHRAGRGRVRDLRGRKTLHPGPPPLPSHPAGR
ncbi:helix-turn-helix domain-containing protein [Rhodococcus koreensis]